MKSYVLADSSSGYVWNWQLILTNSNEISNYTQVTVSHAHTHSAGIILYMHTGKDNSLTVTGRNHSHAVVVALPEKLQGRGHHIYTNNFYSSPDIFAELKEQGFGACGTVRVNRRGLPPELKKNLTKGDVCLDECMGGIEMGRQTPGLDAVHCAR